MKPKASANMHRWGVGPAFGTATFVYVFVALGLTCRFPGLLAIDVVPYAFLAATACLLGLAGAVIYVLSLRYLNGALSQGSLAVEGPYALVRHPIYAAWILLLLPALALALQSWALLTAPVVAYVGFRLCIVREETALEKAFGEAYRAYRAEVPELVPAPRRKRLEQLSSLKEQKEQETASGKYHPLSGVTGINTNRQANQDKELIGR